jgi:purine-binding chemotaxis protein CheW
MGKRYVSFMLAANRFCIPVDQVLQILRPENLLDVPRTPPFVEGVINLRGEIIPVISLRKRLGIAASQRDERVEADSRKRRVVVIRYGQRSYGLAVDEVREIVEIEDAGIETETMAELGERAQFICAVAHLQDSRFLILDVPKTIDAARSAAGTG